MKKFTQLFALAIFTILMTTSCSNTEDKQVALNDIDLDINVTRVGQHETMEAYFGGQLVTIEAGDFIGAAQKLDAENMDAQTVMNINQALMGAEKEAQLLDVHFTMSDTPVENGMFIFGIEAPEGKHLTVEMYDEEGFAMVANNSFDINEGNNYKALNVSSLDNGTYTFRLKDDKGRELNRQVNVESK